MAKKKLVGVVLSPMMPYSRAIIDGIVRFSLEKENWEFHTRYGDPYLPEECVPGWQGDGLIGGLSTVRECHARGVPCVGVFTTTPVQVVPSVIVDHTAVGEMAAEHLLSKGLRHFASVITTTDPQFEGRVLGFERKLQAAGHCGVNKIRVSVRVRGLGTQPCWTLDKLEKFFRRLEGPTGVFAVSDFLARVVVNTALKMGLRVPDDVAVIGEGNWRYDCVMLRPTLTSIDIGAEGIGYRAAELLNALMNGQKWPTEPILLPPRRVEERQSTAVLAVEDADVRESLRFIRSHQTAPIQMSDVLAAVPVGRRTLEMRFHKLVGRTVHEEIRRCHVVWACRMLLDTNLPVARIAEMSAYTTVARFFAAFRRETGMTPRQYRRAHGA